ncbi:MAG TPA: type III PLP-dependent enzyme [Candidatus Mcinerneyibacteriales bacterium]|nr:type III PLP-dependent enzyme [Candidatus Mcinerneyibacteriales bacterium]
MKREPYSFPLPDYIARDKFELIKKMAREKKTPFLVIDLDIIKKKFLELKNHLPFAKIHYAVKANPHDEVLKLLHSLGSNFDVASVYELDQLLRLGVTPDRMLYGNTIKKKENIQYFYEKGVRLFATDCETDLKNIAQYAPGSRVFFRLLTDGQGADWPLSRKFGTHPDIVFDLLKLAKKLDVTPYGISFHVGSQQRDIGQWDNAISQCYYLFSSAREIGIELKMINLGGGFPAHYNEPTAETNIYASEIERFLREDFGDNMPEIIVEPGRSLAGDAGVIVAEIIMTEKKAKHNPYKWMFLDIGMFGGMIETLNESIKYPIYIEKEGLEEEYIIAGPTCDSMDILYEDYKYRFPETTVPGDKVYIFSTGAYTQSYSAVYFNGFPPLDAVVIGNDN